MQGLGMNGNVPQRCLTALPVPTTSPLASDGSVATRTEEREGIVLTQEIDGLPAQKLGHEVAYDMDTAEGWWQPIMLNEPEEE